MMSASDIFFLVFAALGGLALFMYGMHIMIDGLKTAAGDRLRSILTLATRHRLSGLGLGTLLGLLIHSGGTTVMLVGFVNAGLVSLVHSIPVTLGANLGTTLSMQAISFRLGDFAFFAITVGFILRMFVPHPRARAGGLALMGFGLLFLGMNLMSDTIKPHRDAIAPLLQTINADSWTLLVLGILLSAALSAAMQSGSATLGMCFALIQAGVFTSIHQTFPIVLGAQMGSAATPLVGSIGTNIEARRAAFVQLTCNIFNILLAVLFRNSYLWLMPFTSSDLLRQTANLHTFVMFAQVLWGVPMAGLIAKLLTRIIRSKRPQPTMSFLNMELLIYPEQALFASIRELQRVAKICARSLRLTIDTVLFNQDREIIQTIKMNEKVVDDIKVAMKEYLASLTTRYLSKRQAILIQHINRCMIHLERIGDHIDSICDLSLRRKKIPAARVDPESLDMLFELYDTALQVFKLVIESLDPEHTNIQSIAQRILETRDDYVLLSMNTKAAFTDKVTQRIISPIAGVFFSEYIGSLDRIVKHSKSIALAEKQPQFWIKRKKLTRQAELSPQRPIYTSVNPQDYLDRLQSEDYL